MAAWRRTKEMIPLKGKRIKKKNAGRSDPDFLVSFRGGCGLGKRGNGLKSMNKGVSLKKNATPLEGSDR